jgi:ubiquinone/menaquinone biosynthesis C-methylase UbiE
MRCVPHDLGGVTVYDSARYALVNRWDPGHLRTVQRHLDLPPGSRLLEVGCGRGHLVKALRADGVDAVGVDLNPEAVTHAVTEGLSQMDATALRYPDATFDAVVSMHAIEHIPDLDAALAEMVRVVRPGGALVLVYPAEPIQGIFAIPTSILLHGTPLKAREVHCHQLTPGRLAGRLGQLGVGVETVTDRFQLLKSPQFTTVLRKRD